MSPRLGLKHWLRRPSLWVCGSAIALGLVPVGDVVSAAYVQSAMLQPTLVFFILAPCIAAVSAWETSRFKPVFALGHMARVKVTVGRILPWSVTLPLGYVAASLYLSRDAGPLFQPLAGWIVLYALVAGVCWVCIGASLALVLRPTVAILIAAGIAYGWYTVLPALPYTYGRHLSGFFLQCCDLDSVFDPLGLIVAAAGVMGLAAAVGFFLAIMTRMWKTGVALAAVVLAAVAGSLVTSSHLNEFALRHRGDEDMTCIGDACARPEVPREYIQLNSEAATELRRIAPGEWRPFIDSRVQWSGGSTEHLSFSGQESLEGVLGDFVDQSVSVYLLHENRRLCGIPVAELGMLRSGLPWSPGEKITSADLPRVEARLESALCGSGTDDG